MTMMGRVRKVEGRLEKVEGRMEKVEGESWGSNLVTL
jgi:hypothetical protein